MGPVLPPQPFWGHTEAMWGSGVEKASPPEQLQPSIQVLMCREQGKADRLGAAGGDKGQASGMQDDLTGT